MNILLESTPEKRIAVATGRAYPDLAHRVGECLGLDVLPATTYDFANGEMYVRFCEPVRGADVFLLQCHTAPINKWIMEQLIMVDALKRASAKTVTVIAPFLGYSRQDKKHRGREPITARLVLDLFKCAGTERIITVDLHADQEQGFFDGPVDHLTALPVLSNYVKHVVNLDNTVIVSPDAGRIKTSEKWSRHLGGCPLAFIHKTRDITRPNRAVAHGVVGEVSGKDCVIVDDMIDTAGTICEAVKILRRQSARRIIVAATHGLLSGPAIARLREGHIDEIVLCDTVPVPEEKRLPNMTVLSIAPLLAASIRSVFEDNSLEKVVDKIPKDQRLANVMRR